MHQNPFGGRALPRPAGGAYSTPPDPLARLGTPGKGVEKGREINRGKRKRGDEGKEKKKEGGD